MTTTTIAGLTARQLHAIRHRLVNAGISLATDDGPVRVTLHSVDVASWQTSTLWVTYHRDGWVGRARVSVDTDVELR